LSIKIKKVGEFFAGAGKTAAAGFLSKIWPIYWGILRWIF